MATLTTLVNLSVLCRSGLYSSLLPSVDFVPNPGSLIRWSHLRSGARNLRASTNGRYRRKDAPFIITAVNCEVGWRAELQHIRFNHYLTTGGGVGFNPVSRKPRAVQHDGKFFAQILIVECSAGPKSGNSHSKPRRDTHLQA